MVDKKKKIKSKKGWEEKEWERTRCRYRQVERLDRATLRDTMNGVCARVSDRERVHPRVQRRWGRKCEACGVRRGSERGETFNSIHNY